MNSWLAEGWTAPLAYPRRYGGWLVWGLLTAPWLVTGRIGEVIPAFLMLSGQSTRIVVSGYNL